MDEPSDEQLHEIMADALVEVKSRNEKAEKAFKIHQNQGYIDAVARFEKSKFNSKN